MPEGSLGMVKESMSRPATQLGHRRALAPQGVGWAGGNQAAAPVRAASIAAATWSIEPMPSTSTSLPCPS